MTAKTKLVLASSFLLTKDGRVVIDGLAVPFYLEEDGPQVVSSYAGSPVRVVEIPLLVDGAVCLGVDTPPPPALEPNEAFKADPDADPAEEYDRLVVLLGNLLAEAFHPAGVLIYVTHPHRLLDGKTPAEAIAVRDLDGIARLCSALDGMAEGVFV